MSFRLALLVGVSLLWPCFARGLEIDVKMSIPNDLTASRGQTIVVPINLSEVQSPFSLDAFQLIVEYDGTFFETPQATGFALGSLTSGRDYTGLDSVTAATTSFTILRSATTNPAVLTTASAGSLMTFEMTVKPDVALGSSGYLRFLGSQGAARTEILTLSGDTIVFNPTISSPAIGGLVTVPVPEPSTLIMGGAGAVVALIMGRRRKARVLAVRSMH
jgi:hypothetical protein